MLLKEFCVGSRNSKKAEEIGRILTPLGFTVIRPRPDIPDPNEPFLTFRENSGVKAVAFAKAMGMPALADDSGIVVPALSRRFGFPFPGALSARLCLHRVARDRLVGFDEGRVPKEKRPEANRQALLGLMAGLTGEDRRAYYGICISVADERGEILFSVESESEDGVIVDEPRGDNGFGYDPILFVPRAGMTYAEMTAEQKDRISHRGRALRQFGIWAGDMWR